MLLRMFRKLDFLRNLKGLLGGLQETSKGTPRELQGNSKGTPRDLQGTSKGPLGMSRDIKGVNGCH